MPGVVPKRDPGDEAKGGLAPGSPTTGGGSLPVCVTPDGAEDKVRPASVGWGVSVLSESWSYAARYVAVKDVRIHYVEDGTGDPALFLHGNPTWSYMWRNIIPWVAPHARCVAMDLAGMGRSGPIDEDPTFLAHASYVDGFADALSLDRVTLVLHDWGGALGLHWARHHLERVRRIVLIAYNPLSAVLEPVPTWDSIPGEVRGLFERYRDPMFGWHVVGEHNHFVETTLRYGANRVLTETEMDYYREPFLEEHRRRLVQRWNQQVPIAGEPAENVPVIQAVGEFFRTTTLPILLLHNDSAGQNPWPTWCEQNIANLTAVNIGPAGHYIPEDQPDAIGAAIAAWLTGQP